MKALLTGTSRGLGAAIAANLLDRGASVLGLARHENAALGERFGKHFSQVAIDLSDTDALARWLAGDALSRFIGDADDVLLINNAGTVAPVGPPGHQGARAVAQAVALNVAAPLMLADAFITATARARDRRILHISSGAARSAYAGWSVYCATKAALDHHARAVAEDALPRLRICSLAPGVIDTDMQQQVRISDKALFPARPRFEALKREGALVAPADCAARLVDFLLSSGFGAQPTADLRAA
ncbi:SDR family oxidoreductase [Denitromonas iodatirespirans]|uniref:SDR family oxidoreductase n=1 Tax=Denitromonas iodatirespirans TaxID=2795389 RepID=A0A944D9N4_DENI1|nr:SDR family oxidoreductase [Denitromonas iodatirespirans]MBT0960452.1 SDR family oxidoreductase [Denitromonas iodatirespirans]